MSDKALYALSRSEGNQWDFFDKNGKQLIANKYSSIRFFNEEKDNLSFMVESKGKWGLINDDLEEIIPCVYDKIELSIIQHNIFSKNYATVYKDGDAFDIDSRGNIIDETEDDFI